MRYPDIEHHGAKDGVTGSCHQLHMNVGHSLLIDCGLFQGNETSSDGRAATGRLDIEFSLATVQALIVTHVHIDHVGRIPYLLAAGYKGPIYCSEPSAKLLPIVLEDAFKLGFSRHQKTVERYLKQVEQRLRPLPYKRWSTLLETEELIARVRLQRAGHILGSAYVEVDLTYPASGDNKRIVFSGDLGAAHAPLLMPPEPPERADILVLESTYGDRLHEDRARRRQRLEAVIEHALQDQGTVLIPAFSIGRTQELLYELEEIIHSKLQAHINKPPLNVDEGGSEFANNGSAPHSQSPPPSGERARVRGNNDSSEYGLETNWPKLPIILDSPLATRFTEAYRGLQSYWNQEARERVEGGRNPLAFDNLIMIDNHADHIAVVNHLAQTARPSIVIAGNGMCSGGRIVNYLKAMLHDPRHDVLFVGYQAKGTPGHAIQTYGPKGGYVDLDGERFNIRAVITSIGGYSAHADQKGLVEFLTGMQQWPAEIRVVHGEQRAKEALAAQLHASYQEKGLTGVKITFGRDET
ncbi:beta-lactamase domain-containing protein [Stutzerimonas stutzeri ATCC 14405 = CCUG 16156]|uniref:MBL fold metallo-hydrolase n=1 Tax=Stutzerimonas stutzeri TaxID=316 RepID=UPI0002548E33|nr:MBL fold metallo-hydrolase [Stutzerimonas stutzeri]EHY76306.1 beta-lactamase domain-containing protein [Stutzerimonas stutzeri ATCC 14405 = CCUG 16156]QOZ96259.1 MBL fold metallo-hydrolase [Stutzerimonas stutzeri]